MISTPEIIELQRIRWERWNSRRSLTEPLDASSSRPPAVIDGESACRIVITPSDPDVQVLKLDEDFWSWFEEERPDPATGGVADWGRYSTPTAAAAIRTSEMPGHDSDRYLALHRNGALEIGLLRDGAYESREGVKVFRMNMILGRYWSGLELYTNVLERYDIAGPFQIRVALLATKGAQLGGFAEGWREPFDFMSPDFVGCPDEQLLYTLELESWPDSDGRKAHVVELGAWLDDAWCMKNRRCIANRGDQAGEFQLKGYYWG